VFNKNKGYFTSIDKLFEGFPQFEFRYFVLFSLNSMSNIRNQNDISDKYDKLNIYFYNIWYVYTIVIFYYYTSQQYDDKDKEKKKMVPDFQGENEYLQSDFNFFSQIQGKYLNHINAIKNLDSDFKVLNFDLKVNTCELIMETILMGFYLFLNSDQIMQNTIFKLNLSKLLLLISEVLQNSKFQSYTDYVINIFLESVSVFIILLLLYLIICYLLYLICLLIYDN